MLLFFVGLFTLAFGLFFVIVPLQTPIDADALAVVGQNWAALVASNPWLAGYTEAILRFTGSFTAGLGIFGLVITWEGFREGEQ